MYLTRIAGIEPILGAVYSVLDMEMYLTRIAGIEPLILSALILTAR